MAHFAKINKVNDIFIVEKIIVAEKEFIDTLPGIWLQTSFNTRGGIHYGTDNQPDGGIALRKNFATIGGYYDLEHDAFYSSCMYKHWVLNKETFLWEPPFEKPDQENTYEWNDIFKNWVDLSSLKDQPVKLDKTLYLPIVDPLIFRTNWSIVANRLNLKVTNNPDEADYFLPSLDVSAQMTSSFNKENFFSKETFEKITDNLLIKELGFNSLPTYNVKNKEELMALPFESFFIKTRFTYIKSNFEFSYTSWNSKEEFLNSENIEKFWEFQNKPDSLLAQYVIQPRISSPIETLEVALAVNAQSEVKIFMVGLMDNTNARKPGSHINIDIGSLPKNILDTIKKVNKDLKIKGGLFGIQFVKYNNEWCLLDYNPRASANLCEGVAAFYPEVCDSALAFMVGLEKEDKAYYYEQRDYYDNPFDVSLSSKIKEIGLFPRIILNSTLIYRVLGVADNKEKVTAMFERLNEIK